MALREGRGFLTVQRKGAPLPPPPAPIRGVSSGPPVAASSPPSLPPQLAAAQRRSTPRPGWPARAPCAWPPYTICRAAEQNFLINKQDLGFHIGEAMTEEGLGLSPLSAPGPANSSPPGRAERREEGEPGQEHIFWLWSHCLAAGLGSSHFPRRPSPRPLGTLGSATTRTPAQSSVST